MAMAVLGPPGFSRRVQFTVAMAATEAGAVALVTAADAAAAATETAARNAEIEALEERAHGPRLL